VIELAVVVAVRNDTVVHGFLSVTPPFGSTLIYEKRRTAVAAKVRQLSFRS